MWNPSISLSVLFFLCSPSLAQTQTPTPAPAPVPGSAMARATLQIRGAKESDLLTLLSRQLAVGWSTTPGIWDSLWIGTNGHGNIKIWPQVIPAVPTTLPPSGSAGGRLTGTYPNPSLAPSGVVQGAYGSSTRYPAFTVSADGTITSVVQYDLPVIPIIPAIPTTLPPSGAAGGDLSGSYPSPSIAVIGTAKTVGSSTVIPVVTIDTKGRVTALTPVTIADPFTQKIRTVRYAVPSLLGLAISDVAITWASPFPDANYTSSVAVQQSGSLSGILVDWCIVGQTAAGLTVRLKNIGLSAQSPVIHASAIHD